MIKTKPYKGNSTVFHRAKLGKLSARTELPLNSFPLISEQVLRANNSFPRVEKKAGLILLQKSDNLLSHLVWGRLEKLLDEGKDSLKNSTGSGDKGALDRSLFMQKSDLIVTRGQISYTKSCYLVKNKISKKTNITKQRQVYQAFSTLILNYGHKSPTTRTKIWIHAFKLSLIDTEKMIISWLKIIYR